MVRRTISSSSTTSTVRLFDTFRAGSAVSGTALAGNVARGLLGFGCWALLGVGVGAAIRNQTIAVAVPLLWFGVVEQILPSYQLQWLMPWLPGGVSAALAGSRDPSALPFWAALLMFLAYVLALLGPGTRSIAVRDIT